MQPPSAPNHQRYKQSGNGYSPSYAEQNYPSQQAHSDQGFSTQTSLKPEMRLRVSRRQKFFITLAILLISALVLYVPFLILQREIFPNNPATAHSQRGVASPLVTQAGAIPTFMPTPTPGPMGTTILPPKGQILTGVSLSGGKSALAKFESETGKNTSIILLYQAWGDQGASDFPADWANVIRQKGSIPLITWEPWVTKEYPQSNDEPMYSLKNIIKGNFDAYITKWAEDAKSWRNPFFIRFAPEMNGYWTPWSEGINGNTAGEFVKAWKHVHDIYTAVGATNATWVWGPNVPYAGSAPLSEFFPGPSYVDWTALDGFNWGTTTKDNSWLTFSQVFSSAYNAILRLTKKPMMIAETSSVEQGGSKAAWISDAYSVELPNHFPAIRAIVWFNQITRQNWSVDSSASALAAFSSAIKAHIYTSNTFGTYTGG